MNKRYSPDAEGVVTYLSERAGGRMSAAFQEYRAQFHYDDQDWDAVLQYPDVDKVEPGETARVIFSFLSPEQHLDKLQPGRMFLIREGSRTVGYGKITKTMNLANSARKARKKEEG